MIEWIRWRADIPKVGRQVEYWQEFKIWNFNLPLRLYNVPSRASPAPTSFRQDSFCTIMRTKIYKMLTHS